jgi:hypothetical protein
MQNSGIPLAFKPGFLNIVQAFLGLVTLLYLTLILAARHDTRAECLTACADRLEALVRELDANQAASGGPAPHARLAELQDRYAGIVVGVEHHKQNDYRYAYLAMRDDYVVRGARRLRLYLQAHLIGAAAFALPAALVPVELVLMTDMLGLTHVAASYLTNAAPLTLLHIAT